MHAGQYCAYRNLDSRLSAWTACRHAGAGRSFLATGRLILHRQTGICLLTESCSAVRFFTSGASLPQILRAPETGQLCRAPSRSICRHFSAGRSRTLTERSVWEGTFQPVPDSARIRPSSRFAAFSRAPNPAPVSSHPAFSWISQHAPRKKQKLVPCRTYSLSALRHAAVTTLLQRTIHGRMPGRSGPELQARWLFFGKAASLPSGLERWLPGFASRDDFEKTHTMLFCGGC